jgi:hypothetical protein
MTDDAITMYLDANTLRQLGEDGLLVFWREGPEPGRREGLACVLSICPNPECSCQLVYIDGYAVDASATAVRWDQDGVHLKQPAGAAPAWTTVDVELLAGVDPASGETMLDPDSPDETDPALLDWLASEMDGELLEALHRFRARAKGDPPEGPIADIDLGAVEKHHLVPIDELLEGTRPDDYIVGDRRYWTAPYLCPTPWCDCHEAQIVFFDEADESDGAIGTLLLDISGASGFKIVKMKAECEPEQLLTDLWRLFEQRHDVGEFLRRREAQLKAVGETLWRPVDKPVRSAPKIGRNAPCPCGSGRKYKKCCLGKEDVGQPPVTR